MKRSREETPELSLGTLWHQLPPEVQRLCVLASPRALWQAVSHQWQQWISGEQLPWWLIEPLPPWDCDETWERIVLARAGPRASDVPQDFLDTLHRKRCHMATHDAPEEVIQNLAHYVWDLKPLACVNWHYRDMDATFEERGHRYRITNWDGRHYSLRSNEEGTPNAYTSVTTFHKPLFAEFDAKTMSERCAGHRKYAGMTPEQVRALWDENRDSRAGAGTMVHAQNEDHMNGWSCSLHRAPEAHAIYREFVVDHVEAKGLRPFRSEMTVYNWMYRLVGQIDALYEYVDPEKRKPDAEGFVHLALLCDWKCAQKVERKPYQSAWDIKRKVPPPCGIVEATSQVPDCEYERWSMQVNRYGEMLRPYGYKVDALCDVVIHPNPIPPRSEGETRYQRLDVHPNTALVNALSHHRLVQIRSPWLRKEDKVQTRDAS